MTLQFLSHGFAVCLTIENLLACFLGVLVGTVTGVLPGLGPVGAMALLLPLTFGMKPTTALIMFAGIYYGSMYGGSTTSILLNLPGEAASVVTCIDGHEMAKKGRAGAALSIAAVGSFVAGTIGLVGLMLFAPPLARVALAFGPPEYLGIAILGLLVLSNLTGKSPLESSLMVLVGIMLGTIGLDIVSGLVRFTFGIDELMNGIEFPVLAMGAFGLGEVFTILAQREEAVQLQRVRLRDLYPNREEMRRSVAPIFRGGGLGFFVGLIPGPAAVMSSFLSYAVERKISKRPHEFGKGAVEGVAGPESANNAATSGAMVPLLALGMPFAPATALLLTGLMIHGITPGPLLIQQHPDLFWGLVASMYLGNGLLLLLNLPLVGVFASLLKVPAKILMPAIVLVTITGAYAVNNRIFDLWLLIAFGLLGYFMRKAELDVAPLAVGLVVGPMLEQSLRRTLIMGMGSLTLPLTRPISGTMLALAAATLALSAVRSLAALRKGKKGNALSLEPEHRSA